MVFDWVGVLLLPVALSSLPCSEIDSEEEVPVELVWVLDELRTGLTLGGARVFLPSPGFNLGPTLGLN